MLSKLTTISVLLTTIAAASGTEVAIQGQMSPLNIVPTFDHGYLAVYDYDGAVVVYAPDGSLALSIPSPPGGIVHNADIDVDGSVAIATQLQQSRAEAGRLSIFSPDGSVTGEIATGQYVPSQVCFAPDHSIWTLGSEDWRWRFADSNRSDYFLLRHYSRGGELLGEYLSRSSFPPDMDPGRADVGLWGLRIANGRIGMTLRGPAYKQMIWLEANLDGKEIGRWTLPQGVRPSAVTESGLVYAQGHAGFVLDRANGSWKSAPHASKEILLGADGKTLVFAVRGTNLIRKVVQP